MTNREKYKELITDLSLNGSGWGVNKYTEAPEACSSLRGGKCLFGDYRIFECDQPKKEWLDMSSEENTKNNMNYDLDMDTESIHDGYVKRLRDHLMKLFRS